MQLHTGVFYCCQCCDGLGSVHCCGKCCEGTELGWEVQRVLACSHPCVKGVRRHDTTLIKKARARGGKHVVETEAWDDMPKGGVGRWSCCGAGCMVARCDSGMQSSGSVGVTPPPQAPAQAHPHSGHALHTSYGSAASPPPAYVGGGAPGHTVSAALRSMSTPVPAPMQDLGINGARGQLSGGGSYSSTRTAATRSSTIHPGPVRSGSGSAGTLVNHSYPQQVQANLAMAARTGTPPHWHRELIHEYDSPQHGAPSAPSHPGPQRQHTPGFTGSPERSSRGLSGGSMGTSHTATPLVPPHAQKLVTAALASSTGAAGDVGDAGTSSLCEECGIEEAALWCTNCEALFCEVHHKHIHTSKTGQRHLSITINYRPPHCNVHPQQRCILYCTTCAREVCRMCCCAVSGGAHATHHIITLGEAEVDAGEQLRQRLNLVTKQREALTLTATALSERKRTSKEHADTARRAVNETFAAAAQRVLKALEERKGALLARIDELAVPPIAGMMSSEVGIARALQQSKEACDSTAAVLLSNRALHVKDSLLTMLTTAEDAVASAAAAAPTDKPAPQLEANFQGPGLEKLLAAAIEGYGRIDTTLASAEEMARAAAEKAVPLRAALQAQQPHHSEVEEEVAADPVAGGGSLGARSPPTKQPPTPGGQNDRSMSPPTPGSRSAGGSSAVVMGSTPVRHSFNDYSMASTLTPTPGKRVEPQHTRPSMSPPVDSQVPPRAQWGTSPAAAAGQPTVATPAPAAATPRVQGEPAVGSARVAGASPAAAALLGAAGLATAVTAVTSPGAVPPQSQQPPDDGDLDREPSLGKRRDSVMSDTCDAAVRTPAVPDMDADIDVPALAAPVDPPRLPDVAGGAVGGPGVGEDVTSPEARGVEPTPPSVPAVAPAAVDAEPLQEEEQQPTQPADAGASMATAEPVGAAPTADGDAPTDTADGEAIDDVVDADGEEASYYCASCDFPSQTNPCELCDEEIPEA